MLTTILPHIHIDSSLQQTYFDYTGLDGDVGGRYHFDGIAQLEQKTILKIQCVTFTPNCIIQGSEVGEEN